ncbi:MULTISPECIES: GNAT family N-acetyltransferase [Halomicrobium]|uniref:GCN5-related N-acetyltransferase n=2 Tax=Halomicrobium mukohataei TaxID=57705 RepID=C7P0Y3_HALMD|nr:MULTISPECIES: GNAT family N-acetyltransferase [Halomicrobium]ACV48998.1 GCN5-related N-acetyltransferase [Halomicrobium mukohataei DSM 12286]QCD64421.1 GNAT family N-acetyltransferase [Halomicrobium mukohataei]QFR19227.1 GNAT family N-acetyltransferase [Halomicrobium sp. ZPS1]
MYVRDAKNREEVWLLDHIEEMGLDASAFRSRDYVIAIDEADNEKAGFGRIRVHRTDDAEICELTSIGVLDRWRGQGVGAHVIERLVEYAGDQGFDEVYSLTDEAEYLTQFGFEPIEVAQLPEKLRERLATKQENIQPDAVPVRLAVDRFELPQRFRDAFKDAAPGADEEAEPEEGPEDFGIDPDEATYKYDTGR